MPLHFVQFEVYSRARDALNMSSTFPQEKNTNLEQNQGTKRCSTARHKAQAMHILGQHKA